MGLPARLSELEQELVAAVSTPPAPEESQAVALLAEQAKSIERVLAEIRPIISAMFAEIEEVAKDLGGDAVSHLDRAIEQIEAREEALAKQFRPMLRAARDLQTKTFGAGHLSREERARTAVVLERQAKALRAVLRLYRDERWRMIALRAEVEPVGDAPVFGDPDLLLEYLQAKPK